MNEQQNVELKLIHMEDVVSKEVEWLWYPYIPYGKITIIEGDPGEGKTTLVLMLAAALSKGLPLPCDDDKAYEPIHIIYQTAEDGIDDTVKPRLEKAGADCSMIRVIDETEKEFTKCQMDRFQDFCSNLSEKGETGFLRHCSNSAGILEIPEANMDLVRAGISIYGIYPSSEVSRSYVELHPAMELKSHVVYLKTIEPGTMVSYGGNFTAAHKMKIATIPVGYGDGYPRSLSGKGSVLIRGKRAPILGRICMDQFMVDVTGMDVQMLDEVTLLGRDGEEEITLEELDKLSGRFPYEFVCDIGKRVPRVYVNEKH